MDASQLSRRTLLRRGTVAAAGLFGIAHAGPASAAGPLGAGIPFEFAGRLFSLATPDGGLPEPGTQTHAYGELLDTSGVKVGEFYSSIWVADAPLGAGATAAGLVEQHTFNLVDGTIFGSGSRPSVLDPAGTYGIVGGTNRYALMRGTYTGSQKFFELGGDGTASFAFTLGL